MRRSSSGSIPAHRLEESLAHAQAAGRIMLRRLRRSPVADLTRCPILGIGIPSLRRRSAEPGRPMRQRRGAIGGSSHNAGHLSRLCQGHCVAIACDGYATVKGLTGSCLHLAGNGTESGAEIGPHQGKRCNCCHCDQCSNQCVFYRRHTLLILDQFAEEHQPAILLSRKVTQRL